MKRPWILYLLPQAVTLTGIFFGLLSMVWAPNRPYASGIAILLACTCDLIDGRVARWTKTESSFGLQLDSLADIINCGVAPAFLAYHWSLHGMMIGRFDLSPLFVFFFVACAAIRLARFNVDAEKDVSRENLAVTDKSTPHPAFSGVPSPVGAMLICTVVMTSHETGLLFFKRAAFMGPYVLAIGFLMVSTIPFRSLKRFRNRFGQFLFFGSIVAGFAILALGGPGGAVLLCLLLIYLFSGFVKRGFTILRRS
jgi:CDP-diacylglycerol--serine O-phosphatidyltransferase